MQVTDASRCGHDWGLNAVLGKMCEERPFPAAGRKVCETVLFARPRSRKQRRWRMDGGRRESRGGRGRRGERGCWMKKDDARAQPFALM